MITTRKARDDDAPRLARLAEATFRETFGAQNTPKNMDLHCARNYGEKLQRREIACPGLAVLVSESQDELIGFAQLLWGHAIDNIASTARSPAEIHRFYVARAWHGRGVAQQLMAACFRELQARRCDVAWLGVWEHNLRALAFYRKLGFSEVGAHVFHLGEDPQRDLIMSRLLVAPP